VRWRNARAFIYLLQFRKIASTRLYSRSITLSSRCFGKKSKREKEGDIDRSGGFYGFV